MFPRNRIARWTAIMALPLLVVTGCGSRRDQPEMEGKITKRDPKRMGPAELQQYVSTNAALAAADTGVSLTQLPQEPITPLTPQTAIGPRIGIIKPAAMDRTVTISTVVAGPERKKSNVSPMLKIENVTSDKLYENEAEAKNDALKVASRLLTEKLAKLEPPINARILPSTIWEHYVSKNSAKAVPLTDGELEALEGSKVAGNRIRYRFDVELSEEQIRSLRSEDRLSRVGPFVAGGLALCLVANLLLRLTGAAASAVRRA